MKVFLVIAAVLLYLSVSAQGVGIGTATPDSHAMLDISASGKGLLIPRMDSATRVAIASPLPDGLMVFQSDGRKGFWYAVSNTWLYIPDKVQAGDNLGNHTATEPLKYATNDGDKILFTQAYSANGAKIAHSAGSMLDYYAGTNGSSTAGTHRFLTGASAGWKEIMRMGYDGKVGIGTATLASALHVVGAENDGTNAALKVQSGVQRMLLDGNEIDAYDTAGAAGTLYLQNNSSNNLVLVNGGGKVGIGTTTPASSLHVVGAENDGTNATLKVESGSQRILFDGNEIDAYDTAGVAKPLFVQNNSSSNLVLVNGGGNVGIGQVASTTARLAVNGDITYSGTLNVGFQKIVQSYSSPANSFGGYGVGCPVGTILIGGGGGVEAENVVLNYNGPHPDAATFPETWLIFIDNNTAFSKTIRVYALCAKVK